MKLIDADALIDEIKYFTGQDTIMRFYDRNIEREQEVNMAAFIELMPTIDPVRHGKWIRKSPTAWMWTCSCCKKDDAYAYSAGESFEPDVLQDLFCPNCGAKMEDSEE